MDLWELAGGEQSFVYQSMATSNLERQYGFLHSMIGAAVALGKPLLSGSLIKALNFHAIVSLHHEAGRYRSCEVKVGPYSPPAHFRVEPLMEDLINELNWRWQSDRSFDLASYALWKINSIHPFVNGNGRTARAVCYFILSVKIGGLLPDGTRFLEVLRQEPVRTSRYVPALQIADNGNLVPLTDLIIELVEQQVINTQ